MRYQDGICFKISALESQQTRKKKQPKNLPPIQKKCGKVIELEVSAMLKNDNKKKYKKKTTKEILKSKFFSLLTSRKHAKIKI